MIKDFFIKKENIFIIIVALVSIFFVILGFLFLFFKTDSDKGPVIIPNSFTDIVWKDFDSKLINQKIKYPDYMYVLEQKEKTGVGITISEFQNKSLLNYFSNQNNISIYPNGIDTPFFYGKIKESDYTSGTGQNYKRTEYLTTDNEVWAVLFVPKNQFKKWQTWGFIWIQSKIQNKEQKCITNSGLIIDSLECNPFEDQKFIYSGKVSSNQFIKMGYEIIDQNSFK